MLYSTQFYEIKRFSSDKIKLNSIHSDELKLTHYLYNVREKFVESSQVYPRGKFTGYLGEYIDKKNFRSLL